jgi:1-phosphofructokinase family hexose kinase
MFNTPGPVVSKEEWRAFLTHLTLLELRGAYVVISGSLPRGIAPTAYRDIIMLVQGRGARAILDADGACLREGLKARPFAIKPNIGELRRATGRPLRTESELLRTAVRLHRSGITVVLVSCGKRGLLVVGGESRYRVVPPPVTVRSTVGAGDSAVAGYVVMQAAGKSLEDCMRYAVAAGTAATLAPGNQLCRLRDVQRLLRRVAVTSIGHD